MTAVGPEISQDFYELIGKLRRSANTASRYGQCDELQRLADQLIRYQQRLRGLFCEALQETKRDLPWSTLIERVRTEHEEATHAGSAESPGAGAQAGH